MQPPIEVGAGVLYAMEASLNATWERCQQVAHGMDAVLAMIGILPTIRECGSLPGQYLGDEAL